MLVSPIPLNDDEAAKISLLGKVKWLISPNGMHHLHLKTAKARFPDAEIWGPLMSSQKQKSVSFTGLLSEVVPAPWVSEVPMLKVTAASSVGEEFLFFHPPSSTLVMTDLMFNIKEPGGWLARQMMKLNGALGLFTMTRMGKIVFGKRDQVVRAIEKIREWSPQNAVMAHGEPILGGATQRILDSFAWLKR